MLNETLVVQLIGETVLDDESIERQFRWGFVDDLSDWLADSHSGDSAAFLSAMAGKTQPVTLLIPGHKVITTPVAYDKKAARHFRQLLPYQVEDDAISDVETLHFAVGQKEADVVSVAYVDDEWFAQLLSWFEEQQIAIDACFADFQALQAMGDELVLWFTEGYLWGHRANGLGFSVAHDLSQSLLKDLLVNQQDEEYPWQVKVYVADNETRQIIDSHIMPPVDYDVIIGEPPMEFTQNNQLNFLAGQYGKKLPIDKWVQEFRPLAVLAAVVAVVFFATTFADIYAFKNDRAANQQAMLDAYRTVVPRGPANDPVRRLKAMLGPQAETEALPSQSIFLLSKVAPALDSLKIELATLSYSQREQALRLNVKAQTFNGIEQFRQQLAGQGIAAELQSSNAVDEGFQARLRITMEGQQNG